MLAKLQDFSQLYPAAIPISHKPNLCTPCPGWMWGGGFAIVCFCAVPLGCFLLPLTSCPVPRSCCSWQQAEGLGCPRLRMELGENFKSTFVATENVFSFPLIGFFLLHLCSWSNENCLFLGRLQKCLSYSSVWHGGLDVWIVNRADWQLQAWFPKYLCLKWSITLTFHDYLTF